MPHTRRQQQGCPSVDINTSAFNIQHERMLCSPSSTSRTHTMHTPAHSSPRVKTFRIPHRSSSSEPLAPIPSDFKRWRHQRHPHAPNLSSSLPHRQIKNDLHLLPAFFIVDQLDDCRGSATEVRPLTAAAASSKSCIQQMHPSAKCADWALSSITTQLDDSINSAPFVTSEQRRTVDLHRKEVTDDAGDNDKEEDVRKLMMWRAACAMAHAYLYQHDPQQLDLHRMDLPQQNLHESSYNILCRRHPIPADHNAKSLQFGGPPLKDETSYSRVTQHIKSPLPFSSPSSPPTTATSASSRDDAYTPSTCLLSDVVCIDEVVNPTQAAEWFGAMFSSTSTLVS